ncbi:hypothetical protein HPB52_009103 [Rhipicephalus sanguineus]|uniref:Endonuclease/exonuclease/phosphatase domain-containing protein n=1 Tax=Rhipicephalus sanguineus TaxID=34632 RepID=A0A9D4Q5T4_RHISA|nr:hypothetical protein HPB52_009103 [Rhipicephalus sanguineus]
MVCGQTQTNSLPWGGRRSSARGRRLLEVAHKNDLVVLNDGRPTFYQGDRASALDVTMISSCLTRAATWFPDIESHGSDHVHEAALARRRRLLLRFRLAARLCRLKAHEKKPLEKLKELFAESTTGIDRLVVIENRCRFWIFCTVYVVFFVVTVISIGKTLQNHFEYRDIVSISMTEGNSLQLPAVTFCNLNPLRKSAVCSPNTLDMINGTIRNILCDQEGPMVSSMYETTTNPTFGLCYCIFCSNFNASKISYQASNLPVDGLTLVLDIEREEYLRSSSEMGMIVMVHRRGEHVADMHLIDSSCMQRMMERLPAPYKDRCVTMWPAMWQITLVKAVIYFESIIVEKITQVPELSDATTLSNVGGFMGMYLGLSFLVIFEILEIFVRWFIYLYQRRRASVAPQPAEPTASVAAWQRHANKAIQASKDSKGWSKQRSIWDILKDPGVNSAAGGLVALRRPSGAPQYGYFDSSDWKSAADEAFGPFNPLFLHRSFRPRAFY